MPNNEFEIPASKFPKIGTTIFTVMSALAQKHAAINLSQGFPNFDCDPMLPELAAKAMRDGYNQYAPMAGWLPLRKQIAKMVATQYQANYDPQSEITITSGATEALMAALMAVVRPGEEVIIIEPAYDSYIPGIEMAGGIAVGIPMLLPDFKIDWASVKAAINPKTKAILINSPHNPSGSCLTEADIAELEAIVAQHDVLLISDEVYEFIIYDQRPHLSLSRYPKLRDRTMVISSFGKSLHVTGWKVGYCMAPAWLTTELRKVHQFVTFSTSTPFQIAMEQYLDQHMDRVLGVGPFYEKKRDYFLELMEGTAFKPLACEGSYFQLMEYSAISDLPEADFAQWLTKEHKVACIPTSAFYQSPPDSRIVRFCFAKQDETLEKAAEKLKRING